VRLVEALKDKMAAVALEGVGYLRPHRGDLGGPLSLGCADSVEGPPSDAPCAYTCR
jgi:hypothetical protein